MFKLKYVYRVIVYPCVVTGILWSNCTKFDESEIFVSSCFFLFMLASEGFMFRSSHRYPRTTQRTIAKGKNTLMMRRSPGPCIRRKKAKQDFASLPKGSRPSI
jgi:hypothetical protein